VGPRAILDAVVKRKIPSTRRESNPRTPIVQPIAYFGEIRWKAVDWIHLVQDKYQWRAFVNTVVYLRVL
jgi:hypothetical protein